MRDNKRQPLMHQYWRKSTTTERVKDEAVALQGLDDAFTRRFQSTIHFPMPSAEERLALWRQAFRGTCDLGDDVDLAQIAAEYELAGGAIINVLRHCALAAIERGSKCVKSQDILTRIDKRHVPPTHR